MKYCLLCLILFTHSCFASWCDIKDLKTSAVLNTYNDVCNQKKFGGAWGDPLLTAHVVNSTMQSTIDAAAAAAATAATASAARIARLKTRCASLANQDLQDICNEIVMGK